MYLIIFSSNNVGGIFNLKVNSNITFNRITREQAISIHNILRSLGLVSSLTGTRLLNKAIQILVVKDLEIVILEDIYKDIANSFPNITPSQTRMYIQYALKHRDEIKSEKNFKNIFGFEYDEYFFSNKNFIEEIANIIKYET